MWWEKVMRLKGYFKPLFYQNIKFCGKFGFFLSLHKLSLKPTTDSMKVPLIMTVKIYYFNDCA